MAKSKQDNFRLGLYSSANGKKVVLVECMYYSEIGDIPDVEYRQVIPPPGKKHRYFYYSSLPIETFRKRYPLFVSKCVVE